MRLALQLENRSPQGSLIESTRPRPGELIVIAPAAAYTLALVGIDRGLSKLSALPTQDVIFSEYARYLPAPCTRHAVVARLDARSAHGAGLRIDQRQGSVVDGT